MLKSLLLCGISLVVAVSLCTAPVEQTAELRGHSHDVFTLAFAPDGRTLATGSGDFHRDASSGALEEYGELKFWDLGSRTNTHSINGKARYWTVAFSPDGRYAVAGCGVHGQRAGQIQVWDWKSQTQIAAITQDWLVQSLSISPNGERLATVSYGAQATLWDLPHLTNPTPLEAHLDEVTSVAFSPDGKLVATGSWDRTVKLWDTATAACVRDLHHSGPAGSVSTIAFSPDGELIAAGSGAIENGPHAAGGAVTLWKVTSGEQLHQWTHPDHVTALAFSPDGATVASGSRDKRVRLWDVAGKSQQRELKHSGPIEALAFSPDGATLATAARDRECVIRLWDVNRLLSRSHSR